MQVCKNVFSFFLIQDYVLKTVFDFKTMHRTGYLYIFVWPSRNAHESSLRQCYKLLSFSKISTRYAGCRIWIDPVLICRALTFSQCWCLFSSSLSGIPTDRWTRQQHWFKGQRNEELLKWLTISAFLLLRFISEHLLAEKWKSTPNSFSLVFPPIQRLLFL